MTKAEISTADRESRLSFMEVSETTGTALRDFWKVLEPHLPQILDGFYAHIGSVSELSALLGNQAPRLKQAQGTHWGRLFSGTFDDAYMHSVHTIGLTHNRIGLEPRWYIGGYKYVMNRLVEIAVKKGAGSGYFRFRRCRQRDHQIGSFGLDGTAGLGAGHVCYSGADERQDDDRRRCIGRSLHQRADSCLRE